MWGAEFGRVESDGCIRLRSLVRLVRQRSGNLRLGEDSVRREIIRPPRTS